MRVQLSREAGRHVVLDRSMLQDPRLSFRAKGLLAYLLTQPGLDVSTSKTLASISLEGYDAIQTALRELEEAGYVRYASAEPPAAEATSAAALIVSPVSRIPWLEAQQLPEPPLSSTSKSSRDSSTHPAPEESPAARVIAHLNRLRATAWEWARYTPLSAKYAKNVEHINGRLSDGYSEADLFLVLEYLAATDGGKEESRKYFDCVTPFNTKNFERNLALARDWDARGRPLLQSPSRHQLEQSHDPSIYDQGRRGGEP